MTLLQTTQENSNNDLGQLILDAQNSIAQISNIDDLEKIRVNYLGKTGIISAKMKTLGKLPPEMRKSFGQELNQLKNKVANLIDETKKDLEEKALALKLENEKIDVTLPIRAENQGSIHPISRVIEEVTEIFGNMGFAKAEGPEIEDDFHNFTALNIPESHPARQMHDTFYFPEDESGNRNVLRTHTSSVQIRHMEKNKPPYKIISPGRTYRCDSDITHSPMFHQVEGLYIDKNITMAHLKGCLIEFYKIFFGKDELPVRFRPSFFPFTEPSAEMDIGYTRQNGELKIGEGDSWLEIGGCGMVHPNVLKSVNVDPNEYQGFAFGFGIERLAMLKYGISDLRTFFESDVRWLENYNFAPLDIPTLTKGL